MRINQRVNQTAMLRVSRVYSELGRDALYRPWFRGVLEDFDLSLRIAEHHPTAHINDPPLYRYRQYPAQAANLMSKNPVMLLALLVCGGAFGALSAKRERRPD